MNEQNPNYCCYRLQAQKRQSNGETNKNLEECLTKCTGYNNHCEFYIPMKKIQRN